MSNKPNIVSRLWIILFVLLFALVGSYFVFRSSAATVIVGSTEAEQLQLPAGSQVVSDSTASGSAAVLTTVSGSLTGTVTLNSAVSGLAVRVKSQKCQTAQPSLSLSVDGVNLYSGQVGYSGWTKLPVTATLPSGTHKIVLNVKTPAKKSCKTAFYTDLLEFNGQVAVPTTTTIPQYTYKSLSSPDRVQAYDASGTLLATFTLNARTVVLNGQARTFSEPATTTASVKTPDWVRLYPQPFKGTVDENWLASALKDTSPDLFQLAMQYVDGAPEVLESTGRKIAGDANYGPLQADGTRAEGSDFNDFLGIPWAYGSSTDQPEASELNSLDCSGYIRMLFGYRSNMPMTLTPDGSALPRRSFEILQSATGIVTVANNGTQVTNLAQLAAGDLVFFDADAGDGTQIDHVGMYMGIDSLGHYRFISSRKSANGPTMGDTSARSILDGTGYYASAFRGVRRL